MGIHAHYGYVYPYELLVSISENGDDDVIPAGVICLWSGSVASIPADWALCDGLNGTPDLRDRFIVGADAGFEGSSGGTSSPRVAIPNHVNHVVTQPANHVVNQPANHVVTQPNAHADVPNHTHPVNDPGHTHTPQRFPTATGGSVGFTVDTSMSGTPAAAGPDSASKVTGITTQNPAGGVATQPHAGTAVDAHTGTGVDAHAGTAVDAHDGHAAIMWFALAYIMKL